MEEISEKIKNLISWADRVLLISHRRPDADTIGAAVAMRIWIDNMGKSSALACVDPIPEMFSFLPYVDQYVSEFSVGEFDLIIVLDAGASYMTSFEVKYPGLFTCGVPVINIDHHRSNDNFGTLNYVDVDAPSVTFMLHKMFRVLGVNITEEMATLLLAGIYNDTGSFMHSNTTPEVCKTASDLLALGANLAQITRSMFRTKSVSTLKLWGKVLEGACLTDDDVVMAVVKEDDYRQSFAEPEQLSGLIDYLNMVPDSRFSVLVNEDGKGNVKGSLRTRGDDVDLAEVAKVFGGGGHARASGFSVPGKLESSLKHKIVSANMSKKTLEF